MKEPATEPTPSSLTPQPSSLLYPRLLFAFARNSLIRDMTFRTNFIVEVISSMSWMVMNLGFYLIIYRLMGEDTADGPANIVGWEQYQFFVFIATTMLINSLVSAFFMPNAQELSELVRTGGLDFALLKPIDTQFLISLRKMSWSSLGNAVVAVALLGYSIVRLEDGPPSIAAMLLYPAYVLMGVLILYSVMTSLAATSIWLGRNQSLYDFWFYITNFSRYPMQIYKGTFGTPLRLTFTYLIPVLVVINVPAGLLAQPLNPDYWPLAAFAVLATAGSLVASRWVFQQALGSYRSASS